MPTEDFIVDLFCRVDDMMRDTVVKHSQAELFASEVVTLARRAVFAIKGVGNRVFAPNVADHPQMTHLP